MSRSWIQSLGLPAGAPNALRAAVPDLLAWYRATARDLPWRRTRDPYAIWVSEVMLQQTRVATVVPYFERWMDAFPTVGTLAAAEDKRVLQLWEGLGYYSRARNLHRAAQEVTERFGGRIPRDAKTFRSLPGVGDYTAAAVLSIAFGAPLAVMDGNVRRVLCRLAGMEGDPRRGAAASALHELAQSLLSGADPGEHNQALMELGARVCTPRSPACPACPLADPCRARASGHPERFPSKPPRRAVPHHDVAIAIVFHQGQVFIDQRPYGGLLGGLWEFPGGKVEPGETPKDALARELREEFGMTAEVLEPLPAVGHAYTHLRVTLHPYRCRLVELDARVGEGRPYQWVLPRELPDYPMPRANRKVIEDLFRVPSFAFRVEGDEGKTCPAVWQEGGAAMDIPFPPIISTLPEIDISLPGVRGWLLQGEARQVVFFQVQPGMEIPEHSHGAQWGVVLDGEIELTISGQTRIYRKGDTYDIPGGAIHSVRCPGGALALDVFADPGRYRPKGPTHG